MRHSFCPLPLVDRSLSASKTIDFSDSLLLEQECDRQAYNSFKIDVLESLGRIKWKQDKGDDCKFPNALLHKAFHILPLLESAVEFAVTVAVISLETMPACRRNDHCQPACDQPEVFLS